MDLIQEINPSLKILKSFYFWAAIGSPALLVWLTKGRPSKLIAISKVLGRLILKLLDLIFAVFKLKVERLTNFEETSEI